MGASSSSGAATTTTRKGVTYAGPRRVDCLFCRIAAGREPGGAPLWFRDDRVAAFVPRHPAAALHFLIVPLEHRDNLATVANGSSSSGGAAATPSSSSDADLLQHMAAVARRLLAEHGATPATLARVSPMARCAGPPGPPSSSLLPLATHDVEHGTAHGHLHFHRPPFNSIDHLHLHALLPPFTSVASRVTFLDGAPWTVSFDSALTELQTRAAGVAT